MAVSFAVGWRQILASFMMLAATGMIAATYSLVAVPLAEEFQPTRTVLMLSMTVLSGTCAVLAPFLGTLLDKISLRHAMLAGGLMLGAGYATLSLCTTFNQVLLVFGVLMAPANLLTGPLAVTVLLSRWFAERRGRAVGFAVAGISAGGFCFPLVIQALLNHFPWREAYQWLGLILAGLTAAAAAMVVNHPSQRGLHPDGAAEAPAMAQAEMARAPVSPRQVLANPAFWMIAGTVAVVTAGMKGMITNLAPMVMDTGIDVARAAPLISVFAGCSFLAKLSFAAMSDRMGPKLLMNLALGGFASGMICLTQAENGYWVIALGVALTGLFGGLMVPMESYLAPRVFGQRVVGKAMGMLSGVILVAMLSTPPLFGLIFDLTGSYTGIFWTFGGLALATLLVVPAIRLQVD
ncbi:MFS transporter [Mangrovimicrobium sediminis]|uniref:MFS transporter n=1 Tax=Mangrovimicrobium sediminis TaxID=2562682 RepID=A0A4Z0LWW9_9GAMM|nr:MFS transporter [Haliea sp. SAOS-164]TGD71771.1 MFS transporter [Haliea sp. SAOS-164]